MGAILKTLADRFGAALMIAGQPLIDRAAAHAQAPGHLLHTLAAV